MELHKKKILYVGDEGNYLFLQGLMKEFHDGEEYELLLISDMDEACAAIEETRFDLILVQYLVGAGDGLELIRKCASVHEEIPFILLTDKLSLSTMIEAARCGAVDYLYRSGLDSASLEQCMNVCFSIWHGNEGAEGSFQRTA
jgi:DNA-binding NtrC family response regulator